MLARHRDVETVLEGHEYDSTFGVVPRNQLLMTDGVSASDPNEVRADCIRVIRYTNYWILYGFIALVIVSSCAAAIQGLRR